MGQGEKTEEIFWIKKISKRILLRIRKRRGEGLNTLARHVRCEKKKRGGVSQSEEKGTIAEGKYIAQGSNNMDQVVPSQGKLGVRRWGRSGGWEKEGRNNVKRAESQKDVWVFVLCVGLVGGGKKDNKSAVTLKKGNGVDQQGIGKRTEGGEKRVEKKQHQETK